MDVDFDSVYQQCLPDTFPSEKTTRSVGLTSRDTPKARMFAYLKQKSSTTPMSPLHVSEHNLTLPLHTAESDSFLSGLQSNSAVVTENVFNSSRLVTKSWRPAQLRENSSKSSAESLSSCTDCSRVETDNVFASPSCFSGKKIVQCSATLLFNPVHTEFNELYKNSVTHLSDSDSFATCAVSPVLSTSSCVASKADNIKDRCTNREEGSTAERSSCLIRSVEKSKRTKSIEMPENSSVNQPPEYSLVEETQENLSVDQPCVTNNLGRQQQRHSVGHQQLTSGKTDCEKCEIQLTDWSLILSPRGSLRLEGYANGRKHRHRTQTVFRRHSKTVIETGSGRRYRLVGPQQIRDRGSCQQLLIQFQDGFPWNWKELLQVACEEMKSATLPEKNKKVPPIKKSDDVKVDEKTPRRGRQTSACVITEPVSEDELRRSRRSGRFIYPPLAFWANQRVIVPHRRIGVENVLRVQGTKNELSDPVRVYFKNGAKENRRNSRKETTQSRSQNKSRTKTYDDTSRKRHSHREKPPVRAAGQALNIDNNNRRKRELKHVEENLSSDSFDVEVLSEWNDADDEQCHYFTDDGQ